MPASREETLSALNWLIEAGADEAIGDVAPDRFRATTNPPVEGGSKSATPITVRGPAPTPAKPPPPRPQRPEGPRALASITPSNIAPLATDGFGSALELAAMCQSLSQLKEALESFQGSELKKHAQNTVFADGNPDSRIMLIGEAPGRDEDAAGLPFVGRAGKLLDKMMEAIGLNRSTFYIINVLPWRPPDNRNPDPAEVAMCIPFLRRHIELAQPKILILLGAVSARHVLGLNDGIMKLRGRWLEYRIGTEMIPVMPTLHPAYLLRQPAHKKLAWRDLQAVADRLDELGLSAKD
ncbi:MAG: uracil-DNA glycosylase [Alphaproteobacteria bacterium]|nr:uracil-DNA glycosylase [Alphaproteobacteria bacterium]MBV9418527.1 uracil-DNA glycosylase [Alphaproteobacteria bacterium]MBV9540778.1 uracil-DNA glycosylase [Alphaproteobacteria bacterium]MBV9904409.1 uracil-DNA glycosylase [Alphaproteobacteria bacterium]